MHAYIVAPIVTPFAVDDPEEAHESLVHEALLDLLMQDLSMSPAAPFDVQHESLVHEDWELLDTFMRKVSMSTCGTS